MFSALSPSSLSLLPELPPPDLLLLSLSTAAWLAAVTAAVTLWPRLKPPKPAEPTATVTPPPIKPPAAAAPTPACHVELTPIGSPKGRFTVVFPSDDDDDCCHVDGGNKWEEEVTGGPPRWMGVRGDLGWYRYQDRTAINGSVVRLWGSDGGVTAAERKGWELMMAGLVRA